MEINYTLIGISISYGVSFVLLYTRKQSWNTDRFRLLITGPLVALGMAGLLGFIKVADQYFILFSWCLTNPFIVSILDRLFKRISTKKYQRDFHLWLRGSFEINDSLLGKNPHVKPLDKLFSLILLVTILFLPVLGID